MLVSLDWLREYIPLEMSRDELTNRLTLAGLNHEGTEQVGEDWVIDLEVTSNRPDCLGHLGVAREIGVLWDQPLEIPAASPTAGGPAASSLTRVDIECPELCPRYTARVIRGLRVGPSPAWLADRLAAVGIAVINNVVDVTNYVMMECGQPLHCFDFAKLDGGRIIVREARTNEVFTAINHKSYQLTPGMCVIADARRSVALGGVMGGAETEVGSGTTDILVEAADFAPLAIRNAARRLNLHSPSSYRFERGVDADAIDWASRRCCELILAAAGGELAPGIVDVGPPAPARLPIGLRLDQIARIVGIQIPAERVRHILDALGLEIVEHAQDRLQLIPPSWRADLTREIDLVEEVARIHGYDQIPEDKRVAMSPSSERREDVVMKKVRHVMLGSGFDEAMTASAVQLRWIEAFRPWSQAEPLTASTPILRGADCLRQSLVPSLLAARQFNESLFNQKIELFETAKIYLPQASGLPQELLMLTWCTAGEFRDTKGTVEGLIDMIAPGATLTVTATQQPLLKPSRSGALALNGRLFGYLGELSAAGQDMFQLREPAAIAELRLDLLFELAKTLRTARPLSPYPPIGRDLNVVVDEAVRWEKVANIVRQTGGALVEHVAFKDTYRNDKLIGPGKKSLLFSIQLRSESSTMTNQQADDVREQIVDELRQQVGGQLRS